MAANYWLSCHANYHVLTRHALANSAGRSVDMDYASEKEIASVMIWAAGSITRIGKKLNARQFVIATAIIYFRRFYVKNALAETDACLVAAACVYVATKAEEAPVHIKTVVEAARSIFGDHSNLLGNFPTDASLIAEMEFYLISDLDYHLMIWHPYRDLVLLTGREDDSMPVNAQAHLSEWVPKPGSSSFTGYQNDLKRKEEMMHIDEEGFRTAWAILNDTYRSDICLLYPPYLLAFGALYVTVVMHPPPVLRAVKSGPDRPSDASDSSSPFPFTFRQPSGVSLGLVDDPSRSNAADVITTTVSSSEGTRRRRCPVEFFARSAVPMDLVLEVVQEIVSLYDLWNALEQDARGGADPSSASGSRTPASGGSADDRAVAVLVRMRRERERDLAHP